MKNLEEIYSEEWFRNDATPLLGEFEVAAEALDRMFGARRNYGAIDIGCGPGLLLAGLRGRGWSDVLGFDGSRHAGTIAKEFGGVSPTILDVTEQRLLADARGLVICTNVAEQLSEVHAHTLVDLLADLTIFACVFSASDPSVEAGGGVNLQFPWYWAQLFARRGMFCDALMTDELKRRWASLDRLARIREHVCVFR